MSHAFQNFKSFADARISLFNHLTVLIGRNGSGKSNCIEGIELLAALASGLLLSDVGPLGRGGSTLELRGGLPACARTGSEAFALAFLANDRTLGWDYAYWLGITVQGEPRILYESLQVDGRKHPVFQVHGQRDGVLDVSYDNFSGGRAKPRLALPAGRSVLSQYIMAVPIGSRLDKARSFVARVLVHLAMAFVLDPEPHRMRQYERIGDSRLRRNGSNLSAVLYTLSAGAEDQRDALRRIEEVVRQLPDEPFDGIDFVRTELNDVIFGFRRTDGGLTDARVVSDGTLRALSVLTAIETAPPFSRLVIEEFDNGVHPSRVAALVQAVADGAVRRNLNVLVTTQNPSSLDALPSEHLKGVVLCVAGQGGEGSKLVPLLDLPDIDLLLDRNQIGDLVSRGLLERQVDDQVQGVRHSKVQRWFESLG